MIMEKSKKIRQILSVVKKADNSDLYNRSFDIGNGTLILNNEDSQPARPDQYSVVVKSDRMPINEFVSKVENHSFKPSVAFMKRLDIEFTDHFKTKYITSSIDDTTSEIIIFVNAVPD